MGYHIAKITKGEYGKFSKIQEEYQEACDALVQNNPVMVLLELSDLIGAIEGYAKSYNMTLDDVLNMKNATHRAFEDGTRTSSTVDNSVWKVEDIWAGRPTRYYEGGIRYICSYNQDTWYLLYESGSKATIDTYTKEEMVNFLNKNKYTK